LLIVLVLIFSACNELPPEPGNPGTGQAINSIKTGAAVQYVPESYAPL
jgi:hypothetical protein